MSRWLEMHRDAGNQAYEEAAVMKVLKHLPREQRTAAQSLINRLVTFETFRDDEEFSDETQSYLYTAVRALKEAIKENVPREVLLAILDRDSLNPKPVSATRHG